MYSREKEEAQGRKEIQVILTVHQAEALAVVPTPNLDGMDACWSEKDFNLGLFKIREALRANGIRMAGDPLLSQRDRSNDYGYWS